jgi:hypothetical protein
MPQPKTACGDLSKGCTLLNFNKVGPINARDVTRSRAATFVRSFTTSATTLLLPHFPLHLAPGLRRCSAISLRLGEHLCSLGGHLQVFSLTTRLCRLQRAHVLQGGIIAQSHQRRRAPLRAEYTNLPCVLGVLVSVYNAITQSHADVTSF